MTVSAIAPVQSYAGNGSTTVFATAFKFLANAQVTVTQTVAGVTTTLTEGVHYTLSGAGNDAGGNVTMLAAPASGSTITIRRRTARTQSSSLRNATDFTPKTNEAIADKGVLIAQDIAQDLEDTKTDLLSIIGAGGTGTASDQLLDLASNGTAALSTAGRIRARSNGGAAEVSESGGGYKKLFPTGVVYLNDLGGVGDGSTDCTAAFGAFFAGVLAGTMRKLFIPRGVWSHTGLSFDAVGKSFTIEGEDGGTLGVTSGTVLKYTGASGGTGLHGSGWGSVRFRHVNFDGNSLASKVVHVDSVKADGITFSASFDVEFQHCGFFKLKTSDTNAVCLALGSTGAAGLNAQVSEIRAISCLFRGNEFSDGGNPWGAGFKNLTGGNCKNFWAVGCQFYCLDTGIYVSGSGGSVGTSSWNYFGSVRTCVNSSVMQMDVVACGAECESITGGARFINSTTTNAPGALTVRNCYVAIVAPSDDLGIIANGGHLTLEGNHLWNKRTSDYAHPFKVQAWSHRTSIAEGATQPGSVVSRGNFYYGVAEPAVGFQAYAPIYDPGGSSFFTDSNGMRSTGVRAESVGDYSIGASGINFALMDCLPQAEVRANALTWPLPARETGGGIASRARSTAKVNFADLVNAIASGTAATLQISTIPKGWRVVGLVVAADNFTAPSMTSMTFTLGTPSSASVLMTSKSVHGISANTRFGLVDADLGTGLARATAVQGGFLADMDNDVNLNIVLTSDVNLHTLTAGELRFSILMEQA
jgi:hypothetical protein